MCRQSRKNRFYFIDGMHIYEGKDYKSVSCVIWLHGRSGMEELMYQKEIIYLGLYKDGDRLGSAGFLKVEKRDKAGNLSLVVKNVPHSINGKYPVRYYNGSDWKELEGIIVREGGGQWEKQEPDSSEQIRLQIMLPGGYLVEGVSKETARLASSRNTEESGGQPANVEPAHDTGKRPAVVEPEVPLRERTAAVELTAPMQERTSAVESAASMREEPDAVESAASLQEPVMPQGHPRKVERIVVQRQSGRENAAKLESKQAQKPLMADSLAIEGLKEDKWEQILDTYDNLHPYDDGRVYVKLEPKDFIILSGKYQHLVNNSFLLHGFYNYRHVILGKEGEVHYLGVPGVFYEREKMVALMFGFEAFECGSREPKAGEFGYYLRQVEL